MLKLLILILIIAGAFWLGRLSAKAKRHKIEDNPARDDSSVIDIEVEDESKS